MAVSFQPFEFLANFDFAVPWIFPEEVARFWKDEKLTRYAEVMKCPFQHIALVRPHDFIVCTRENMCGRTYSVQRSEERRVGKEC